MGREYSESFPATLHMKVLKNIIIVLRVAPHEVMNFNVSEKEAGLLHIVNYR